MATATASGPTPALPDTSSYQVGDGNVNDVRSKQQAAEIAYTGSVTLLITDLIAGIISYTGAGHNLTLPLATDMDAAFPNAKANFSIDFSVIATTGTATVVTSAGWTIVGALTVAASTATLFRARKTAAGAWTLYRVS